MRAGVCRILHLAPTFLTLASCPGHPPQVLLYQENSRVMWNRTAGLQAERASLSGALQRLIGPDAVASVGSLSAEGRPRISGGGASAEASHSGDTVAGGAGGASASSALRGAGSPRWWQESAAPSPVRASPRQAAPWGRQARGSLSGGGGGLALMQVLGEDPAAAPPPRAEQEDGGGDGLCLIAEEVVEELVANTDAERLALMAHSLVRAAAAGAPRPAGPLPPRGPGPCGRAVRPSAAPRPCPQTSRPCPAPHPLAPPSHTHTARSTLRS
jgi:hypothetical protein